MNGSTRATGSAVEPHDAIVLAGGRATRLGGAAKPELRSRDGVPLLHLALDAAGDARRIAVVGPDDLTGTVAAHPAAPRTLLTREDPPFGGPVAAIAAGFAALGAPEPPAPRDVPWVLILAVDVPRAADAVPRLADAVAGGEPGVDGAHLVAEGRAQWLVGMYRTAALRERLAATTVEHATSPGRGISVRRLLSGLRLLDVPDPGSLSADVDTWDDAENLGVHPGPSPKERA
ncbi:molybdenum cofactor guanylyltransferase [Myceligenerans salitolerans]|uniref:molybdenum cofactor guanylyltransferase n=1 Tax=Myceligenerans salitolerans TaxID=1230528 RepID=UPI0027DDBABE|nr:NTP transferase domain-containing protein [Myceligenerans salitolerans]